MGREDESELVGGLRPGETLVQQMGRFAARALSIALVTNTYHPDLTRAVHFSLSYRGDIMGVGAPSV